MRNTIGKLLGAGALVLILSAAPTSAADTAFEQQVIQRLDRIEQMLRDGGSGGGIRSVANFGCQSSSGSCNIRALQLCQQAGYTRGVASRAGTADTWGTVTVTEVTCS